MNILTAGLKRLLANIIRIGIVSDVSLANGLCRVKIGNLETDWLNWLTLRAGRVRFWSAPSVGEQVMVLSIGGELTTGFVLPAIFSDAKPAPSQSPDAMVITFPDGARFEYEPETSHLAVTGIATAVIDDHDHGGVQRHYAMGAARGTHARDIGTTAGGENDAGASGPPHRPG
ncbi:phage baseplate assembly protein V [Yersinia pekkanenii]|uniref:Baseplate assembly protein V n=1 Tax=Yersinia pekkanenii TaxID=1288385 RepID=A0A0T9QWS2_9GAMM|nr:phage baseplate assembly protein V [Yersinia pekkanenii]CNI32878.1 baseplate assembly protein V [Yersinia pekkanenii]CRY66179.1 baseplate assembly protein V [Yersinia pekkanenii]